MNDPMTIGPRNEQVLTPAEKAELIAKFGNKGPQSVVAIHCDVIDDRDDGGSLAFGLTLKLDDGEVIHQRGSAAVLALGQIDEARNAALRDFADVHDARDDTDPDVSPAQFDRMLEAELSKQLEPLQQLLGLLITRLEALTAPKS